MTPTPPAEIARIAAGYGGSAGLKRMAKRLRRGAAYCRQLELHGAPFNYAEEAARLLRCSPNVFLPRCKTDFDED